LPKKSNDAEWESFTKKFPKGAKVQLNVGGPTMVVKDHAEPSFTGHLGLEQRQIVCQWFSGKKLETGRFAPETLVLVEDGTEKKQA